MDALSIVTIGGLSLVFLMFFSNGFCDNNQPNGGAFCWHGFKNLGVGQPVSAAPSGSGGGNCQFLGNGRVCWFGSHGQGCIKTNPAASDNASDSGRKTLCARARQAYLEVTRTPAKKAHFAVSYPGQVINVA